MSSSSRRSAASRCAMRFSSVVTCRRAVSASRRPSRNVVTVTSSAVRFRTSLPRVLRSLRFSAWTRRTALAISAAISRVSRISRCNPARSAAVDAEAKAKTSPSAKAQRSYAAAGTAPCRSSLHARRRQPDAWQQRSLLASECLSLSAPRGDPAPIGPLALRCRRHQCSISLRSGKTCREYGIGRCSSRGKVGRHGRTLLATVVLLVIGGVARPRRSR